jgi:ABC-type uncharacterized transport system involved in gliding motility auxiliary subunit
MEKTPMENTPNTPPLDAPKTVKIGKLTFTVNVLLQALIFIAIVVMINYISRDHFVRDDWSRNDKFTLSSQTKALLSSLDKPVKAIVCVGVAGLGQAAEVEQDAQELLREYSHASKGKLTVEMVNLGANFNRGRELQNKYKFGANESLIILDYDGKSKFVYSNDMAEYEQLDQMQMMMQRRPPQMINFKGEQVLTSALLELTEGKQSTVYLVTGHREYDLNHQELAGLRSELQRQNLKLESLNLSAVQAVPEGAQAVVILGPRQDFSERDLKLLTEYWDKKGRVLVAVGPSGGKTPNLDAWLGARGLRPQQDYVINVQNLGGLAAQVPLVAGVMPGSPVTKELEGAGLQIFGPAQSIELDRTKEQTEQLRLTPILQSDKSFWGEMDYMGQTRDSIPMFDPRKDKQGPLTLGATAEKGASQDPKVKLETARLVLFSAGDFLSDRGLQMAPDGAIVAINAINWLLNRENLIAIPPKAKERVSYSLTEDQLGRIARWVCLFIPAMIGVFGLYHLWWRHGKNMFTLTFWLAVAFLIAVGFWYLLLWYLGVESAKSFPKGLAIAVSTAVIIGIAALLMNSIEQKKKIAAKA